MDGLLLFGGDAGEVGTEFLTGGVYQGTAGLVYLEGTDAEAGDAEGDGSGDGANETGGEEAGADGGDEVDEDALQVDAGEDGVDFWGVGGLVEGINGPFGPAGLAVV